MNHRRDWSGACSAKFLPAIHLGRFYPQ